MTHRITSHLIKGYAVVASIAVFAILYARSQGYSPGPCDDASMFMLSRHLHLATPCRADGIGPGLLSGFIIAVAVSFLPVTVFEFLSEYWRDAAKPVPPSWIGGLLRGLWLTVCALGLYYGATRDQALTLIFGYGAIGLLACCLPRRFLASPSSSLDMRSVQPSADQTA